MNNTTKTAGFGGYDNAITINISEMHVHMQDRTDIHNFYPDGSGGLAEAENEMDCSEPDEAQESDETTADIEKVLKEIGAAVVGMIISQNQKQGTGNKA